MGEGMTRDWSAITIEASDPCRICGSQGRTERAHVSGRTYDERTGKGRWKVHPLDIVPLCGPALDTASCHYGVDHGQIDLLPFLTVDEQVRVVQHLLGIENARIRLAPLSYKAVAA